MPLLLKSILLLPLYLLSTAVCAQDIILTKSGNEIVGKVMRIGADSVTYRYLSDVGGPAYTLPRQEVAHVKRMYATQPATPPEISYEQEALELQERQELILQAKLDAKAYYKGKGVFWTTMSSTILSPLAGFATGTVVSAVKPNVETDDNPNHHLQKDPVYQKAYREQAHRRKIGKAAAGFGAGVAMVSILSILAANMGGI
ncbi:hypothetical protein ACFS7Z_06365 [Pontibacter toksunensis]|uniref:DUF3592 domain-containing protein n=1 Tax=Pontibacter toksunensis TaxID=1332631 RepID=A0ABW6BS89_9BACT